MPAARKGIGENTALNTEPETQDDGLSIGYDYAQTKHKSPFIRKNPINLWFCVKQ